MADHSKSDAEVLAELLAAHNACFDRVSDHLYREEDTTGVDDDASAFLGKARALVRTFEEGPQQIEGGYVAANRSVLLSIVSASDIASGWTMGAREWQVRIEQRSALVEAVGREALEVVHYDLAKP